MSIFNFAHTIFLVAFLPYSQRVPLFSEFYIQNNELLLTLKENVTHTLEIISINSV